MIVETCVSALLDANCYVVAAEAGAPALVIDPGWRTAEAVTDILARHNLHVGAVVLTHGHPDHVWDAAAVAGDRPVYIPQPDMYRMDDPASPEHMGPAFAAQLSSLVGSWVKPPTLLPIPGDALSEALELVEGVPIRLVPAPGHTEGSSLLFTTGPVTAGACAPACADAELVCFDGDVIFAGAVGRTDLPGGDARGMMHSLRTLLNVVSPDTVLLPGHGPATTMGHEATTNPYLNQARHVG